MSLKNPVTPPGIDRGTVRLVAQRLNHYATTGPVFLKYFVEIITPLVMENKRHYHGQLDRIDDGPFNLPDVTEAEMLVFLGITMQMGQCIRYRLTDYWANN